MIFDDETARSLCFLSAEGFSGAVRAEKSSSVEFYVRGERDGGLRSMATSRGIDNARACPCFLDNLNERRQITMVIDSRLARLSCNRKRFKYPENCRTGEKMTANAGISRFLVGVWTGRWPGVPRVLGALPTSIQRTNPTLKWALIGRALEGWKSTDQSLVVFL